MDLITPDTGMITWTLLAIVVFVLWILALVRILTSRFPGPEQKIIWLLVVTLLPALGPILYFLIGNKSRRS